MTFDVSADSDGSHGAWPEFVITDKPVPGTRVTYFGWYSRRQRSTRSGSRWMACTSGPGGTTGVGTIFVARNGVYDEPAYNGDGLCDEGFGERR